jgi:hypothetical protein
VATSVSEEAAAFIYMTEIHPEEGNRFSESFVTTCETNSIITLNTTI